MTITGDDFVVSCHPEKPGIIQFLDYNTMNTMEMTVDEAFSLLKVMLDNRGDLRQIRTGADA